MWCNLPLPGLPWIFGWGKKGAALLTLISHLFHCCGCEGDAGSGLVEKSTYTN